MSDEFRLLGWYAGWGFSEWSRNSPKLEPNSYERCRELMRLHPGRYQFFEIQKKERNRWVTHEILAADR